MVIAGLTRAGGGRAGVGRCNPVDAASKGGV
jgi:hypothetical protein